MKKERGKRREQHRREGCTMRVNHVGNNEKGGGEGEKEEDPEIFSDKSESTSYSSQWPSVYESKVL